MSLGSRQVVKNGQILVNVVKEQPRGLSIFFCGNRQKDHFLQMLNRKEGFLIMTTQPAWIILYALVSFDQQNYAFTEWLKKRSAFFFSFQWSNFLKQESFGQILHFFYKFVSWANNSNVAMYESDLFQKLFKRYIFCFLGSYLVDTFLCYLPLKQIWSKSAL